MESGNTSEKPMHFLDGLKALSATTFPKVCSCGRRYETLEGFLAETAPLKDSSGLMAYGTKDKTDVGMFRNCTCGSTLMIFCDDRRDESPAGARRRKIFEELLGRLEKSGVSRAHGRERLLKALRTGNHNSFFE